MPEICYDLYWRVFRTEFNLGFCDALEKAIKEEPDLTIRRTRR